MHRSLVTVSTHPALLAYKRTWNLPRNRAANFGLGVFEHLDECGDQVSVDDLFVDGFCYLDRVSLLHVLRDTAHTFSNLSATMYRTRQLLSSKRLRSAVSSTP